MQFDERAGADLWAYDAWPDDDGTAFAARFIGDVAALERDGAFVVPLVAGALAGALARGGLAWRPLYRLVASTVRDAAPARDRDAYARLHAFLEENRDLDDGVPR